MKTVSRSDDSFSSRSQKQGFPLSGFAVLLSLCVCLGFFAWSYRKTEAFSVPSATIAFVHPRTVHADGRGNWAVVDSGERRIIGMKSDGSVRFVIQGEKRGKGFYSGRVLGFDSKGNFYVDNTVLDSVSSNTAERSFLRFSGDGKFLDAVVSYVYSGDAMADWEHQPIFPQVLNDTIYWFLLDTDGTWRLKSKSLVSGEMETSMPLPGVSVYDFTDAVSVSPREAYLLSRDGTIIKAVSEKEPQTVFPSGEAKGLLFPTALALDPRGTLLAADGKRTIIRIDPGQTPSITTTVLDRETVTRSGYGERYAFMDFTVDPDGTIRIANEYSGDLVAFPPSGKAVITGKAALPRLAVAASWAAFIGAWLSLLLLASAIVLFYLKIFKRKAPLVLKQLAVFVPLIAAMTVAVAALVFTTTSEPLETAVENRLRHLAQIGASEFDPADTDALAFEGKSLSEIEASPAYEGIMTVVDRLINENKDPWNSSVFDYFYKPDGGSWWVLGSFDYIELYPYVKEEFERVLATGESAYLRYDDIYGAWLSAFYPVMGTDGKPKAVFEATMSADVLDEAERSFVMRAAGGGLAIIAGFLAAFTAFTLLLLKSIKAIKAGTERIAEGDYDVDVTVRSKDEIQDLGDAFNSMSREIRTYIERITRLNEANSRFVPSEFLSHLGKTDIAEIKLGDQVKTEMSVVFSDIRSFTDMSENMTPAETFAFLNGYLSRIGPQIREQGGFIDKYIGDAILALFPGSVDTAFAGIYAMVKRLADINRLRAEMKNKPIEIGIGIHHGPLMIGIIGESMRYDGTVLSDAVNLASRLEGLTKYYGVKAIVSESTWNKLERPESYPSRFLDAIRVKGRGETVRIREPLFPGDPDSDAKRAYGKFWLSAWKLYAAGRLKEALEAYEKILAHNPNDEPARLFRDRCANGLRVPQAEGWDGITSFEEK